MATINEDAEVLKGLVKSGSLQRDVLKNFELLTTDFTATRVGRESKVKNMGYQLFPSQNKVGTKDIITPHVSLLTMSATTPQIQDDFKVHGIPDISPEDVMKDGIPIGDAIEKLLPLFEQYPDNLKEIKVEFEAELISTVKGGVEVKFFGIVADAGGDITKGKTHRIEFLLKKGA